MEQLPEFWRTEVFHPLSVHFPIALLLIAFVFKLVALRSSREVWEHGGTILLLLGTLGAWIAIYTGNLADGIVSRQICDPTILKDHENLAYLCAWLFTAAAGIEVVKFFKFSFLASKLLLVKIVAILLMATGSVVLTYVGHLGATLVYQQGAGVYMPSGDCAEFE